MLCPLLMILLIWLSHMVTKLQRKNFNNHSRINKFFISCNNDLVGLILGGAPPLECHDKRLQILISTKYDPGTQCSKPQIQLHQNSVGGEGLQSN